MIIWLASYPKSGNTWVRSFITTLLYSVDGQNDFSNLSNIRQFPDREFFKNYVDDFKNIQEIAKNWSVVQSYLNLDGKIKFFKTHHINCTIDKNAFLDLNNTIGVIHIVRDPRNVVTSIKNHYAFKDINTSKEKLFNENNWIGFEKSYKAIKSNQVPTLISSWKNHYLSWKNKSNNYLLIKYEDLIQNPHYEFNKIAKYISKIIGINFTNEKIEKSIETNKFSELKKLEKKGLFLENAFDRNISKKINFFNLGPDNDWRKILEKKISDEIEFKFNDEMRELGYL